MGAQTDTLEWAIYKVCTCTLLILTSCILHLNNILFVPGSSSDKHQSSSQSVQQRALESGATRCNQSILTTQSGERRVSYGPVKFSFQPCDMWLEVSAQPVSEHEKALYVWKQLNKMFNNFVLLHKISDCPSQVLSDTYHELLYKSPNK